MDIKGLINSAVEEEVVKLTQQLIQIKTINPPGDELPLAEYVSSYLKKVGLEVELINHSPNRASVLARLKSPRRKPGLLFNAHLDTVPIGNEKWIHEPFKGEVAEGRIWGRGSADMKGGLAVLMVAVKAIAEAQLPLQGDLILAVTAGEEVDSLGATTLSGREDIGPVQAVMIPEPSNNDVFIAEKGALWLEISTHGKTAHGGMPELGRNAVMMMIPLLTELQKMVFPFKEHPLLGGFTQSVNTISGGVKTNVVPDHCAVTVDMRTVPGQDHKAIVKQIENLISDLGKKIPDFKASVRVTNDRIPIESSPDEPVIQGFFEIVSEVTGERPVPKGVRYYTDAVAFVPVLKTPMIICGPGEAPLAHQPNEYVEISKLIQSLRIFTLAGVRFLL